MNDLPELISINQYAGADYAERWNQYLDAIYQRYVHSVAHANLTFQGQPVHCQFRPEAFGKHFAFWHIIQEGSGGRSEDERTPDPRRCERIDWIAWAIRKAPLKADWIRVFPQTKRGREQPWAIWLHEARYVVILWERRDYFLLKTAFCTKPHKEKELARDWNLHASQNG